MKKTLSIILLFLIFLKVSSQTNRFIYELQYRKDSTQDYRKNLMVLDINPEETKFYDYNFIEYDSLNKNNVNGISSRYSTKTDQVLIRKKDSGQNFWYRDFFDYFITTTNDDIKWKLLPETQTYNGYKLQKAIASFGGRNWTAWFSKEINLQEGPYKFRGLPGLIFIIQDSDKNFVYKLVKNIKLPETYDTNEFIETHYGKNAIPIKNEKFNKYIENIYKDPIRMFSSQIKEGGKATFKNESVESIEELNKKKAMLQNGIKERYIFIEKDKSPRFE